MYQALDFRRSDFDFSEKRLARSCEKQLKRKNQLRRPGRSLGTESAGTLFPGTQENEMYQETGLVSQD